MNAAQSPEVTVVSTEDAPAAIGPYSQGVVVRGGRTLYSSGQIALDAATGAMVEGGVREQAEKVMENLSAVLAAAGMGFEHVVRGTIYLVDLAEFGTVNEVYAARFSDKPPARACVQVAALPKGALVEIDVVAVAP
jgi:2-iminobutanoate/2-iminopropanoate deaminase